MQNRDFRTRITSLHGSQTSPVVLCMHNGVISTMNTGLSWSQTNLSFCACKSAWLAPKKLVSLGPRHNLSFCVCKTAWLASDLLVSMGPSPHLWFLHAKQRLLDQSKSLYGCQTSLVVLCIQNSVICTRISSLYGFQPSSVVFACKTATFGPDLQVCIGPSPHL